MNNDMDGRITVLTLVVVVMVVITAIYIGGYNAARNDVRAEAIEAGVAHWEADPKTGDKTFVWHSEEPGQ